MAVATELDLAISLLTAPMAAFPVVFWVKIQFSFFSPKLCHEFHMVDVAWRNLATSIPTAPTAAFSVDCWAKNFFFRLF